MTGSLKVLLIILDGVGIGALPDAATYGDEGSNTLANLASASGGLKLPNLERMGLGNISPIAGVTPQQAPEANFGRMAEASPGKDSVSGHWEIAGLILDTPFPTYPDGFPPEVIDAFTDATGKGMLGNKAASGTEIIKELGDEHVETGKPIVYTSADSVFQVAAHTDVIPLEELYEICKTARALLRGKHAVARVIARPFTGPSGAYTRTPDRKDFAVCPPRMTLLDQMKEKGLETISVGKVDGIMETLAERDLLVITADHGNDPTTPSTDHSREYVPLLVWGKGLKQGVDLGTRKTFSDLGATIGEVFGIKTEAGTSFLDSIRNG